MIEANGCTSGYRLLNLLSFAPKDGNEGESDQVIRAATASLLLLPPANPAPLSKTSAGGNKIFLPCVGS